jgi:hypothetical protein
VERECPDTIWLPPAVVPTRRLYERPKDGVWESVEELQLKVTSYGPVPETDVVRPVGAEGTVFADPELLR